MAVNALTHHTCVRQQGRRVRSRVRRGGCRPLVKQYRAPTAHFLAATLLLARPAPPPGACNATRRNAATLSCETPADHWNSQQTIPANGICALGRDHTPAKHLARRRSSRLAPPERSGPFIYGKRLPDFTSKGDVPWKMVSRGANHLTTIGSLCCGP